MRRWVSTALSALGTVAKKPVAMSSRLWRTSKSNCGIITRALLLKPDKDEYFKLRDEDLSRFDQPLGPTHLIQGGVEDRVVDRRR